MVINIDLNHFFDQFNEKILLTDYLGGTYEFNLKSLSNMQVNQINLNKIKNNSDTSKVLDTLVENDYFYISYIGGDKSCETMNVAMSKIENLSELKFEKFFLQMNVVIIFKQVEWF